MADKKIIRQVTMKVYDDDTVDFAFVGTDGWPAGKMQRQLNGAARMLKGEQRTIRQANDRKERTAILAKIEANETEAAKEHELKALISAIPKAKSAEDVEGLKQKIAELKGIELTGDESPVEKEHGREDTGRKDAGTAGEPSETDGGVPVPAVGGVASIPSGK